MCKRPCKGLGDLIIDSVMYVSGPSQKTPEWYQERAVRLTGSNWYNILKGKEKPSGLIGCRHGSKFSEMCKAYGDRYEKAALRSVQTFLNPSGLRIEEAKFYIPQSHPFLGATPDGIIVKDINVRYRVIFYNRMTAKQFNNSVREMDKGKNTLKNMYHAMSQPGHPKPLVIDSLTGNTWYGVVPEEVINLDNKP